MTLPLKHKKENVDYIIFATKQARSAEAYGFSRNECCRNLKIALHQFWQHRELGLHGQIHKNKIPRSKAAKNKKLNECQVEHAVPLMWFVDQLMDMTPLTKKSVESILKKYFRVLLVTEKEHRELNASGLRSTMPKDWDKKSAWARYEKLGIKRLN